MNSAVVWFLGLSRIAKVGMIGVASMTGLAVASVPGPADTGDTSNNTVTESAEGVKKSSIVTTAFETEKVEIPFDSTTHDDASLPSGETRVEQVGSVGEKTLTRTIVLTDGVETSRSTEEVVTREAVNQVTRRGTYVAPVRQCDSNYTGGCVPVVNYDLDCPDIGFSVVVVGVDVHRFDRDKDGYGCESY